MPDFQLYHGDCLDILPTQDACSIDTVITDPPYGLKFMGKDWDHGVPGKHYWLEVLRVAKPGAMLLAFGGTRTHHRLMCAIEDAGWLIRDVIMWVYGEGFPKSHNISKAIDKAAGAERKVVGKYQLPDIADGFRKKERECTNTSEVGIFGVSGQQHLTAPATSAAQLWDGWGTALKPAYEPIIMAIKPRDGTFANNALKWGVAGLNIDGGRVESNGGNDYNHWRRPDNIKAHQGFEGRSFAMGDRSMPPPHPQGRWPANLIHDGSDEVMALFPQTKSEKQLGYTKGSNDTPTVYGEYRMVYKDFKASNGSAARFFYCAKASQSERNAGLDGKKNNHPTIKPLALMRYLCTLTKTPVGGVVLDPFMGSGSTGCATLQARRDFIGIDQDLDSVEIAQKRIAFIHSQMNGIAKIVDVMTITELPMFGELNAQLDV